MLHPLNGTATYRGSSERSKLAQSSSRPLRVLACPTETAGNLAPVSAVGANPEGALPC